MKILGVSLRTVLVSAGVALLCSGAIVYAAQSNFLGVVFIGDPTTTSQQMAVNSDGSINVKSSGGSTGSTIIGADAVALSGGAAITMFSTGHCANGCRISVPVAFCTNPLTTATSAATTGGNECWQPNQSVAMPPTAHAISVYSASAGTASGIGSTVP